MQQQTTVLSTSHGSYLSPGVAFSPCHIQQIGAVSLNGLPATPIAQTSGEAWSGPGRSKTFATAEPTAPALSMVLMQVKTVTTVFWDQPLL